MVAGGGLPTAVPPADRARPHVLAAIVLLTMSASDTRSAAAAASLPLFLKERPLASEVKDWLTAAKLVVRHVHVSSRSCSPADGPIGKCHDMSAVSLQREPNVTTCRRHFVSQI